MVYPKLSQFQVDYLKKEAKTDEKLVRPHKEPWTFTEKGTITHEGRKFVSGGAHIGTHVKTGKLGGVLYAFEKEKAVGSWDGKLKIPATFAREYRDNFGGKRQTVYFTYQGRKFIGTYYKSQGDIVRVKEIKG